MIHPRQGVVQTVAGFLAEAELPANSDNLGNGKLGHRQVLTHWPLFVLFCRVRVFAAPVQRARPLNSLTRNFFNLLLAQPSVDASLLSQVPITLRRYRQRWTPS